MQPPLHVLVVDDEEDVQWLFKQRFRRAIKAGRLVFHFAFSGEEALRYLKQAGAAGIVLVLSDINMPGMSCFEAAKRLQASHPDLPIVFLSAYWNDAFIEQAQGVGACGLMSKSEEPDILIDAIRTVVDGGVFLSEEVRSRFQEDPSSEGSPEKDNTPGAPVSAGATSGGKTRLSALTPREVDVLRWVGMGQSRKQMAAQLGISDNTVAVHTNRIMKKLDIHDRVGLARFAIKIGLSPLDESV